MMFHRLLVSFLGCALLSAAGGCQLHPRPVESETELPPGPAEAQSPFTLSHMHVQTMRATPWLYTSTRTSFIDMPGPASQAIARLRQLTASGLRPAGPILFIYHDPTEDLAKPFDLDIGLPLRDTIAAPADLKIEMLPAFRCATVTFRGPLKFLPKAYDKLIPEMIAAGLVPSDQTRESYLGWEGPDSPNNVVLVEVGIR